jgi:hypothetical protein
MTGSMNRDILPRLGATLDKYGVVRNLEVACSKVTDCGRRIESVIG